MENPTIPKMKHILKICIYTKKQEKATHINPKDNARAAKASDKCNRGRSPSRGRMSIPDKWKGLCMRCVKPTTSRANATPKGRT